MSSLINNFPGHFQSTFECTEGEDIVWNYRLKRGSQGRLKRSRGRTFRKENF